MSPPAESEFPTATQNTVVGQDTAIVPAGFGNSWLTIHPGEVVAASAERTPIIRLGRRPATSTIANKQR
jgi:hypothetical protein